MPNNKRLLTIPDEQWSMIQYEADKEHRSLSAQVRKCIDFFFEQRYRPGDIALLQQYKPDVPRTFPAKRNDVEEFEP